MPTIDGGDDLIGIGGPDEWLGVIVVLFDEAVDSAVQVVKGFEDTAFEAALGELGEEAFDGVEPGAGSGFMSLPSAQLDIDSCAPAPALTNTSAATNNTIRMTAP